jgi:hypothetical protein
MKELLVAIAFTVLIDNELDFCTGVLVDEEAIVCD